MSAIKAHFMYTTLSLRLSHRLVYSHYLYVLKNASCSGSNCGFHPFKNLGDVT